MWLAAITRHRGRGPYLGNEELNPSFLRTPKWSCSTWVPSPRPAGSGEPGLRLPRARKLAKPPGIPIYSLVSTQLAPSRAPAEQVSSTLFSPPHSRLPFTLGRAQASNLGKDPSLDPDVPAFRPPDNAGATACCTGSRPGPPLVVCWPGRGVSQWEEGGSPGGGANRIPPS